MAIIDNLGQNAKRLVFTCSIRYGSGKILLLLKVAEALLAELPYILEENS